MNAFTPVYTGAYSTSPMLYNNYNFTVSDNFKYYVESLEIVYDSIFDKKLTGFNDVKYTLNPVDATYRSGQIAITLVGDLPSWLMSQLIQLAKACLGAGMILLFSDVFATNDSYNCHWENAGDFVENNELLCGGTINLKFYELP